MSKYFQVLERLERGRTDAPAPRVDVAIAPAEKAERGTSRPASRSARPATAVVEPADEAGEDSTRAMAIPPVTDGPGKLPHVEPFEFVGAAPLNGIDAVFHNVEVLTGGRRPMTLVFAGASATDWVPGLVRAFTAYAEKKGEQVLVAELRDTGGDRTLLCRRPAPDADADADGADADAAAVQIDLRGGASRETLARWRAEIAPEADITLVVGPPLASSVDSALLASLCDGLVLVAVHDETHRAALALASERVRVSRCASVAVMVNPGREKLPTWVRRILDR